jgi:hypothetical protein
LNESSEGPIATLRLRRAIFEVWTSEHCRTIFDDGGVVPASPSSSSDEVFTAADLGYGTDLGRMVVEHELAHNLIAEWRGLEYSPALERIARERLAKHPPADDPEEALVCAFQAFANGRPLRAALLPYAHVLDVWIARWHFALATVMPSPLKRVVIIGPPRVGKSTLATFLAERTVPTPPPILRSDDLIGSGLEWSEQSDHIRGWIEATGPYIIEGVGVVRALRKWLRDNIYTDAPIPFDVLYFGTETKAAREPRQEALAKGFKTIWDATAPMLMARGFKNILTF